MAAGLATLKILSRRPEIYDYLETIGARLEDGVREIAAARPGALSLNRVGSMATLFFHPGPVRNWDDASRSDRARFAAYHRAMLDRGVYMPCSQFEAFFLNAAMTDCQIDWTVGAMEEAVDIALQA
ncbi:MAG: Glutamate-1-semialdehyde 2,1-aminomutase [candidate division BRC1 bacterium ADurb.BinA364]|nr:MAG: Glutamate-1-semialdehyde 2,1-aminomutase [candidate division BRC1 bacterium ADurb.BinA364]